MKDKPSEWVSIADLMAGVMAVVMLLLVLSIIQRTYAAQRYQQELRRQAQQRRSHVAAVLEGIRTEITQHHADALAEVDMSRSTIVLRDTVFARGSACLTPQAIETLTVIDAGVREMLSADAQAQVYVEGHTDSVAVARPVTDLARFCTVYDDNFTLSAARARETRKRLISALDYNNARRVVVAGFGDSHPLSGLPPEDGRNRRVEVRFVQANASKSAEPSDHMTGDRSPVSGASATP